MKNLETIESKVHEIDFEKIQVGNYAESFLKFMAEKFQESFDDNMRGLLENDGYLSNDEIELIIENHLPLKNDKDSFKEKLHEIAKNKFDNLEKLAFYPNFMESIPMLSEGFNSFIEQVNAYKKGLKSSESNGLNEKDNTAVIDIPIKKTNLKIENLELFFENAPITKKSLDGLIQIHHKYPQRLVAAIEEQFFPHILLPNDDKQAIFEGVKNYIKTMSEVIQSGAILMDKSKNRFTYLDKTSILENPLREKIKAESLQSLPKKLAQKGQGITVYQDHNLMYSLIKNFGKNFSQSFKNTQFKGNAKANENKLDAVEYTLRKEAVNAFVNKLEKVIGKQEGIENLKAQKDDISLGKFSDMIKINDVEARYYLIKKGDRYLVSLLPKRSENAIQQDLNGYVITKTDSENLKINQRMGKQFVGISNNDENDLKDYFSVKSIPNNYISQLKAILVEQKDVPSTQKKLNAIAYKIANTYEGTAAEKRDIKTEITQRFVPYTGMMDDATGNIITSNLGKNAVPKSYQGVSLTQDEQKMILEGKAIQLSGILTADGSMSYESTIAFNPIKQSLTNQTNTLPLVAKAESIVPAQREMVESKKGNETKQTQENRVTIRQKDKPEILKNTPKIKSERKIPNIAKSSIMKR